MDDLARGEIDVAIRIDGHGDVLLPMRRLSELAQEGVVGGEGESVTQRITVFH
jgi:hypothetical protein